MAKYVCVNPASTPDSTGAYPCYQYMEYQTSIDMLAITQQQADAILVSSLAVVFGAWGIRQVLNLILRRRY